MPLLLLPFSGCRSARQPTPTAVAGQPRGNGSGVPARAAYPPAPLPEPPAPLVAQGAPQATSIGGPRPQRLPATDERQVRPVAYRQDSAPGTSAPPAENPSGSPSATQPANPPGSGVTPAEPLPPQTPSAAGGDEPLERLPAAEKVEPLKTLTLDQVIQSVLDAYPLLRVAFRERQVADGKRLAARGEFDLTAKAATINQPLGFYQTYRQQLSLEQPTFSGGYLYGGYRIGRGSFQPWYKERETNDGGEFALALGQPLLKNRAIDERRAGVWQSDLDRQIVEPRVRMELLNYIREASQAYWTWVASGQVLQAQQQLLELARARVRQIEQQVEAGDLGRIVRINNDQLIASREAKVIESERKLQMSAIKLSLFLRDASGRPVIPDASLLPNDMPSPSPPDPEQAQQDIAAALAARPELNELDLTIEQVRIDLAKAENSLLPKLDAIIYTSKDVGGPSSKKRDKTPFELEAGLYGELPVQRREARGKIQSARGKLAQLRAKRQFVVDKIVAEVQDVLSALRAAAQRYDRARTNLRLAGETLELGRGQFDIGDIDLISLNIYEQAVTDAQFMLIAAQADYLVALAEYRAALARDPQQSLELPDGEAQQQPDGEQE